MAKTSRFPQGVLAQGDALSVAKPVGTVLKLAAGSIFFVSTNASSAAFESSLKSSVVIADPGNGAEIPVTSSFCMVLTVETGAETNTLPAPAVVGQEARILAGGVGSGGSRAITVAAAFNSSGNTVITFDAEGEYAHLEAVQGTSGPQWQQVTLDGATGS